MTYKCSSKKNIHMSLTLNQKLKVIKLSEEGMSEAEIGQNKGLSHRTVSQVAITKEKFLKERNDNKVKQLYY